MNNFGQITQTASFVPKKAVTNDQLAQIMDTSDEWIQSRTGIKERRITTTENTSDLCIKVAEKLLEKSQYSAEELDFIIVATMSPDYYSPSVACLVQGTIGANHAMCFDLSAACSGFVYALSVADKLVRTGAKKGLVIGGEVISKTLDWTDRSTAVLFGDGAGGVLLEASETEHITAENLQADGKRAMSLTSGFTAVNSPYSENETSQSSYLSMEGREIFDFAVRDVVEQIKKVMNQQNREIDYFLLHQANARILDKIAKKVNVSRDKFLQNMDRYGNTSAASIPILLDEAVASKKIVLGNQQNVILSGFGGGLTWATLSVIL
ncbi:beta-ketoacyl-ACP synthase III [Tetragenococcus halophilus]|uniref:beta-ketoacyl-ACP synthase III n=1 Tax=Tetragenococcus halophilus TaxID=51669 RepID=UPI00083CF27C|nr:beta-ketoacyl-ACP synthase III [Tetragenococcus halophilus]AOF49235.1 3-oxoacyl-ACP synthase [Tetragenococcus halophilus]NWO01074.1 ketoacyl-ACP synthase III [Tetragenococcus halophilus]GBD74153.1 3-oxoacyl-[acyl-carrier-protein] synthase III [Tetragenococcus halophilus subsp. halophilus]GBD75883.1 3-oxoacyl-[acyl-carrier-protein] synthase III [Tetragenococcus halophilus subsp. halophilus]GFK22399.1 3-oxoacyl-ACP synthase 3 [Tetragenococcus halophilus]